MKYISFTKRQNYIFTMVPYLSSDYFHQKGFLESNRCQAYEGEVTQIPPNNQHRQCDGQTRENRIHACNFSSAQVCRSTYGA